MKHQTQKDCHWRPETSEFHITLQSIRSVLICKVSCCSDVLSCVSHTHNSLVISTALHVFFYLAKLLYNITYVEFPVVAQQPFNTSVLAEHNSCLLKQQRFRSQEFLSGKYLLQKLFWLLLLLFLLLFFLHSKATLSARLQKLCPFQNYIFLSLSM